MSTNSVSYLFEARDNMSRAIKTVSNNLGKLDSRFKRAKESAARFTARMKHAGEGMQQFGRKMRMASIAIGAAIGAGVYNFSRMEKGLMNVQGLMEKDEIKKYSKKLAGMQTEAILAGFAIEDVNKGMFDTVSALTAGKQAFETYDIAQKLAIGGNTDLGTALDGITSIIGAYGKENVIATEAAEAFYAAQVVGKTTVQALASAIGTVAPVAKGLGITYQELLATMSAMTLGGMKTDMATTALKATFNALNKPGTQAIALLDKLGIAHGRTAIKAAGLKNVLLSVIEANKDHAEDLDKAIPNIRASVGLMSLNASTLGTVDVALGKMNTKMGETSLLTQSYNRINNSTAMSIKRIKGSLSELSSQIGDALSPAVRILDIGLHKLTIWFIGLPKPIKVTTAIVLALAAAISILAIGLGTILVLLPILTKGFAALNVVFGIFTGLAVILGAPLYVVIIAIAAVAAGVALVIVYWDNITTAIYKTIRALGKFISMIPFMGGIGESITGFGQGLIDEKFSKKITDLNENDYGSSKVKPVETINSISNGKSELEIFLRGDKNAVEKVGFESNDSGMNLAPNTSWVGGG